MVIQVGDSTAAVKQEISDLLDYVTGDGEITSWLNATNRINEVADILGRDGIADGMAGATARARINALWDGPVWAPGADLAMDFREGLYYRGTPTDTHATDILALGSGGYETFAPNVPPITDLGLLTTVGRTNLLEWSNDFTQWSADGAASVEAGQISAPMAGQTADRITVSSGGPNRVSLYTGTLSAGTYTFQCLLKADDISHVVLRVVEGSGTPGGFSDGYIEVAFGSETVTIHGAATDARVTPLSDGWYLAEMTLPLVGGAVVNVRIGGTITASQTGSKFYAWGAGFGEGSFATDPIITEGSAVTRPGNMPVIDLTGRLGEGVAGVIAVDILQPGITGDHAVLSFTGPSQQVYLYHDSGNGKLSLFGTSGTPSNAYVPGDAWAEGRRFIAFSIGENFVTIRTAGGDQGAIDAAYGYPALNSIQIGGRSLSRAFNTYQRTERLALKFGPQDQASFDAMYALAQEWAAE